MPTPLARIEFPEVFYGIVAPVGTDIKPSIEELRRKLRELNYEVIEVKVTKGFDRFKRKFEPHLGLQQKPYDQRILTHIAYGNQLRRNFKSYALMAEYAIFQVAAERKNIIKLKGDYAIEKTAYIIHQFKREEEIDLLRSIYGDLFTQISIYSSRETRIDHLSRLIAKDHRSSDLKSHRPSAEALVNQDQNEANEQYGQRVSKIFHEADFVINSDVIKPSIDLQISRFLEIQFSSNKHSPTKFEYGVFLAKSAALRSLDLSRQVGAAIFTPLGEILSLGSNEVPKARGGTYWSDDEFDDREYKRGVDTNEKRKREIVEKIYRGLQESSIISSDISLDKFLSDYAIAGSRMMDALEYGRIIHAEMNAITDAARLGKPLAGSILYSTTFPCHMCAKHIVSSGISEVVFLEPYPKSLAEDLHNDSIEIEGSHRGKYETFPKVRFTHFYGITPRSYMKMFARGKRKNEQDFVEYIGGIRRPNVDLKEPTYIEYEKNIIDRSTDNFKHIIPEEPPEQAPAIAALIKVTAPAAPSSPSAARAS